MFLYHSFTPSPRLKKNNGSLSPVSSSPFGTHETRLLRCSFLFQHKWMYVEMYGSRTSTMSSSTTTSSIWSSRHTISSRYILCRVYINSCYSVVLYLLWNLCNNHPFLGDTIFLQVKHMCQLFSTFVLLMKKVDATSEPRIILFKDVWNTWSWSGSWRSAASGTAAASPPTYLSVAQDPEDFCFRDGGGTSGGGTSGFLKLRFEDSGWSFVRRARRERIT